MKSLGITLVGIAAVLVALSIFFAIAGPRPDRRPTTVEVQAENGQTMSILPLLAIVSFATGAALITASYLTRKR